MANPPGGPPAGAANAAERAGIGVDRRSIA